VRKTLVGQGPGGFSVENRDHDGIERGFGVEEGTEKKRVACPAEGSENKGYFWLYHGEETNLKGVILTTGFP